MHRAPRDRSSPIVASDRNARRRETWPTLAAHERTQSCPTPNTPEVSSASNRAKCAPNACRKQVADTKDRPLSWLQDTQRVSAASVTLPPADSTKVHGAVQLFRPSR